ncbi:YceD family protein [Corynebacterium gerontici]|uniref:Large ribosomal RNA subunit accumulation protein YceD n=1 Tax=Corynebacterium gerontici TaxID=2079234 RepID=A0A3G6J5K0_9CORY|nr:YceD family protein [Corynebacterium gerontici]AZA11710.1 hypothetical protein CGERO_07050 [Corynebacterium gerontici]
MKNQTSPFVFEVGTVLRSGLMEVRQLEGDTPVRIGPEMIAVPEGAPVSVEARLNPLGDAIMVDASLDAQLSGQCVRCLAELSPKVHLEVQEVFAADEDFIQGEDAEEAEETPLIEHDTIDLTQLFLDEAGLNLPFSPVCEGECEGDVPEPDTEDEVRDVRWAGLEKFL